MAGRAAGGHPRLGMSIQRHEGMWTWKGEGKMYLQSLQARLLFLQSGLFFPLVHFGERYASVGQRGDGIGESAGPGREKRGVSLWVGVHYLQTI